MHYFIQPYPAMRFSPFHELFEASVAFFFKYFMLICLVLTKLCMFLYLLETLSMISLQNCETHIQSIPSLLGDCMFVYEKCFIDSKTSVYTSKQFEEKDKLYYHLDDFLNQAAKECPNFNNVKTVFINTSECGLPILYPYFTYEIEGVGIPYRVDASKIKETVWYEMVLKDAVMDPALVEIFN
jgi:hypothetical protein